MKTFKKIQLFILFIGLLSFNTCVENDNLNIPVSVDVSFTPGVNDIVTDINSVLGKSSEEQEIYTEMRTDAARLIMRRLQALSVAN